MLENRFDLEGENIIERKNKEHLFLYKKNRQRKTRKQFIKLDINLG